MPFPASFSPQSSLSSAPSNPEEFLRLATLSTERLASYRAEDGADRTLPIIRAFLLHLPRDGIENLQTDIIDCHTDVKLRELGRNLQTAVLIPSKY